MCRSYYRQSASSTKMQSQVFQAVRRKNVGTALAKDRLHHKPRVYIQIARTAVILGSSPFYYSDVQILFIAIIPIKLYTLIS